MILSFLSLLGGIDVLLDARLIPLRDGSNPSKALTLLISPMLIFLIMVRLSQLSWGTAEISVIAQLKLTA